MIEVLISDWGWVVLKLKLEVYRVISSCETERKPVVNLKERDKETRRQMQLWEIEKFWLPVRWAAVCLPIHGSAAAGALIDHITRG